MASPRVQRWSLTLGAYNYKLEYRAGKAHGNANAMSRLPLPGKPSHVPTPGDVVLAMNHMENSTSLSVELIRQWTQRDPTLSKVYQLLQDRWPNNLQVDTSLKLYSDRRSEYR